MKVYAPIRTEVPKVPCGLHLATISNMYYAKGSNGELLYSIDKETGEICNAVTIVFDTIYGTLNHNFWLTEKAQWVFEKFYLGLARKYDPKNPLDKSEVIGQRMWIIYAKVVDRSDDVDTETGKELVMDFRPFTDLDHKPNIAGDPLVNDGVASGVFLIVNEIFL